MNVHDPAADGPLFDAITAYILDERSGDFEDLALRLFARHFSLNGPYRDYCTNLGAVPGDVHGWSEIPAVPARAFKLLSLSCCAVDEAAAVFYSSGTTEGQPSRHYLDQKALALYEISLRVGYARVAPGNVRLLALMQPPADAPHSSLSYMLGALGATEFFWSEGDRPRLAEALDAAEATRQPVAIFSTAFALLDLFDNKPDHRWTLPQGSVVIETGGFKGRSRQVTREELYSLIADRLGMRPPQAFAEYGMSEMASQYYSGEGGAFSGGHWVRARVIDPLTDADAEEGILRHFDLANWNSVSAIQTQDLGRMDESGRFWLLGRAPESELRGCSLTMEEQWERLAAR